MYYYLPKRSEVKSECVIETKWDVCLLYNVYGCTHTAANILIQYINNWGPIYKKKIFHKFFLSLS